MGYKLNGRVVELNQAFIDSNGTQYPANWLRNSTAAERAAVPTGGITWADDEPRYDGEFYFTPSVAKNIAELKPRWIQKQKDSANAKLSGTDWMVTRKAEVGTAIPSATATYRAAVRTKCAEREATLNACADTETLRKTIRGLLAPTVAGTASNGATEKKKEDGSSYDPKQYNDITNPALLEDWPTEP